MPATGALSATQTTTLATLLGTSPTLATLSVTGDIDCNSLSQRQPLQIQNGSQVFSGTGAPSALQGVNGDFYFRKDGGGGTHIYFKASGTWSGII
jgi:hypothetical protein